MGQDYERETRQNLHLAQEKWNKQERDLRIELAETKQFVVMLKLFFAILGLGIIVFDLMKDAMCQSEMLRYNPGMGWQQWMLMVLGFTLLLIGIYKKPKGK